MRFTITPLGGARRSLRQIVAAIVDYLVAKDPPPPAAGTVGVEGPSRYYADRGEGPGRWLGRGATDLGLAGEVDREDFAFVLGGRDPSTGARLITAQGSAGRRPRLGVGTETCWDDNGEGIYDTRDAAAALEVDVAEVEAMLDLGAQVAIGRLLDVLSLTFRPTSTSRDGKTRSQAGTPEPEPGIASSVPGSSYLVPVIDADGERWVTEADLSRCEEARAAGVSPDHINNAGASDDLLTIAQAARIVGVTPRYLRGLAHDYQENKARIDQLVTAGQQPRRDYLVAHKNARGHWQVRRSDLAAFVERREPPAVRAGYDLTLTTEKSLSVLALLSEPRVGAQVLDAIHEANDHAIAWLETHTAQTRVQGKPVPVDGWTVGSFRHLTSRALDPFAHWHNVVANTVKAPDGTRRALHAYGLYLDAQAASALATAQARWRITQTLGVRWRPGRKTGWEIADISDPVLDAFSQRRNELDDAIRELEEEIGRGARPDEVDHIALRTRPAKQHTHVEDLRAEWAERARSLGLDPARIAGCVGQPVSLAEPDPDWIYAQLARPDGICSNLSIFDYGDLLAALVDLPVPQPDDTDHQPLLVSAERLERLAHGFVASPHVVQLTQGERPTYTTSEILGVQQRIIDRYAAGLRQHAGTVPRTVIDAALADQPQLTAEQRRLVRQFCGSGHTIQCAIGHPGAGKTTTMATACRAWETAGYRVVGAAVKGEAARLLGDLTGITTETLAWWLAHPDPVHTPLDARTVLVVDEASTISDRDLDRLIWICEQTGATLRLLGDPAQHGAVEAGGMFRVLCERHPDHTPQLTRTHRVRDPHDRAAATALRQGQVEQALDHLEAAGHLHILDNELDFYRHALARWWNAHLAGHHHPMVDGRNIVRRRLNRLAHQLLQTAGHIGHDEITSAGDRRFSIGDRVIARTPARDLHPDGQPSAYVRNGATGTITRLHHAADLEDDQITVAFDGIGGIALPRSYFDQQPSTGDVGLDHAYAVTSYAVQGATNTLSISRLDQRSTRAEMLVDITRGQHANHLYLTPTNDDPLDGETLPRTPPPHIDHQVADHIRRTSGEHTAWEVLHRDLDDRSATPTTAAVGL